MHVAREGDLVLLIGRDRKESIVRLKPGSVVQTHQGCIQHDDLLGKGLGRQICSHLGHPFVILEPSTSDFVRHLKRTTQIMFPKDIGYILLKMNIMPGIRVIEAGTGSGGLTLAMARAIGQSGRLFSYEIRRDILAVAHKNLDSLGLAGGVEFKLRDIADGFDEREVDALFLDVRQPWAYLFQVSAALRSSGFFGAIVPTANQVIDLIQSLESHGMFGHIEVEEVSLRPYKVVPSRLRPMDRMVAHTGYLVFARKVLHEVGQSSLWKDKRRRKYEEAQCHEETDGEENGQ
jgi:tRNA (adenine57-N1/adenine58-N1)-methyltransferase